MYYGDTKAKVDDATFKNFDVVVTSFGTLAAEFRSGKDEKDSDKVSDKKSKASGPLFGTTW
jgi:hypothetical protein